MAASLDEYGREVLDQTPRAIPVPFTRPEPIHLRLRRIVEQYHRELAEKDEYESFSDADDFDVADGAPSYEDAPSEYEGNFMPHLNSEPAEPPAGSPPEVTSPEPAKPEDDTPAE